MKLEAVFLGSSVSSLGNEVEGDTVEVVEHMTETGIFELRSEVRR